MAKHTATFKWPNSHPSTVIVTGTFDNWSGNTHHLRKEDHGFVGEIEGLDWDTAYDYKYVVDGNWQVRDDESKSWDASGNTNNVYRTPSAPPPPPPAPVAPVAPVAASAPVKPVESKPVEAVSSAPVSHDALLASSVPGTAASIAPSNRAVKDEPLVSTPPASIAPAVTEKSSTEPTPAQAIVEQTHHKDDVKADVEPSPATTPKPLSKALEPIASITSVEDARHAIADSDATLAGLAGTAAAVAAGLMHQAEEMVFGHGTKTVEKSAEDQTDALKKVDVPVLPVPPTGNYVNQDSTKVADSAKSVDPLATLNLGKPVALNASGPSEAGTVGTDFSRKVVDNASTTSHPDNFERVPTPTKLADEPAVVVPKPSAERFEHVQKEETLAAPVEPVVPAVTASSHPAPIPGSGESIPPSVPTKDTAPSAASHTEARSPYGESLTAPLVTAAPVSSTETKGATAFPTSKASGYSTPPAVVEPTKPTTTNGTAPPVAVPASSTPVVSPPTAQSTPVKAVPGSYPNIDSVDSTPANTPSKLSTKSSKVAEDDDKLRKRKSSLFGKIGSMFGKKDKN